jgi:hypothetical protein
VGTVITTGDQPLAAGFNFAQVAVVLTATGPQLYPHIGTDEPSGREMLVGAAIR